MTKCQNCGKPVQIGVYVAISRLPSGMSSKEPPLQEAVWCIPCFKTLK